MRTEDTTREVEKGGLRDTKRDRDEKLDGVESKEI